MRQMRPIILLLCLSVSLAACGKKGPVRPKLQPVPAAPANFTIEQRGARFLLAWDIPRRNQDGSPLEPQAFRILRMHYQPAEDCADCREDFEPVREVDLDYLQGARRRGDRLFWWDEALQPERAYRYQVLAVSAAGRPGAPATAQRLFVPPPLPPQQLQAAGLDRLIRLDWQAPPTEGTPAGYNIYRWQPDGELPPQPINERPVAATTYDDVGLENGRPYRYAVTTVAEVRGQSVESLPAEPVTAVPGAEN